MVTENTKIAPIIWSVDESSFNKETMPFVIDYFKDCIWKYDYSDDEKNLLYELLSIATIITIEASDDIYSIWKYFTKLLLTIDSKKQEFLEQLSQLCDIKAKFPNWVKVIQNENVRITSLIVDFFNRERNYYGSLPLYEILNKYDKQSLNEILLLRATADKLYNIWLQEEASQTESTGDKYTIFLELWKPARIVSFLDEDISGQDEAKKYIAVELYNHIKRLAFPELNFPKSNLLLIGPTGSGKTEMFRKLSTLPGLPITINIVDSTVLTSEGYVGVGKTELLTAISRSCDNFETGILVLDEFDKLATPDHTSYGEDRSFAIQKDLLKLCEQEIIICDSRVKINPENLMVVLIGAFEKLRDNESATPKTCGFITCEKEAPVKKSIRESLLDYGMNKELLGRIKHVLELEALNSSSMEFILYRTLEKYSILYSTIDNCIIKLDDSAKRRILEIAESSPFGARQIFNILGQAITKAVYTAFEKEEKTILITKDDILT